MDAAADPHPLSGDPDLEAALLRASHDDSMRASRDDAGSEAAARLRDATILVPLRGAVAPSGPPGTLAPDRPGSWPALIGDPSQPLLPAFTSMARLRDWRPGARFVGLPLDEVLELASIMAVHGVVIDAGADHALLLLPQPRDDEARATGADDEARVTGADDEARVTGADYEAHATGVDDGDALGAGADDDAPGADGVSGPPRFFGHDHPIRCLAAPLVAEDLAAIDLAVEIDPALGVVGRAWAVELHAPDGTVRLVVAVDGTWPAADPQGVGAVAAIAARLHGRLRAPGYLDADVVALTDQRLATEVALLDDPVHPR